MKPNQLGTYKLNHIDIQEVINFIDWRFFFLAWKLSGTYKAIQNVYEKTLSKENWLKTISDKDQEKAEEALKLYIDAQEMLSSFKSNNNLSVKAIYALYPARSVDDNIIISTDEGEMIIPTLRQQHSSTDGFCYSLADFLSPNGDYVGMFATTIQGGEEIAESYEQDEDMYSAILVKTISDRLAEAAAEWLHWKVRTEYWGYASDEKLSVEDMLKTRFEGIRPAVGYPSLPDQSIIFDMDKIMDFAYIQIKLTENGAMYPNASVSGFYFSHPKSKYFMIGKIDEHQLVDYAKRRGQSVDQMRKWLISNL